MSHVDQHGNYAHYYGHRLKTTTAPGPHYMPEKSAFNSETLRPLLETPSYSPKDSRLFLFEREFFSNKRVLDIGCNAGHLTAEIGNKLFPNN